MSPPPSNAEASFPVDAGGAGGLAAGLPLAGRYCLRRSDPRALVWAAAILSIALVTVTTLWLPWLAALLLFMVQRQQWRTVVRRLCAINVFMIFLWLSLPFTVGGEKIAVLGMDWSIAGVRLAALSTGKANAIALVFMLLLSPLGIHGTARAMAQLRISPKLVLLFLLTANTVYQLRDHFTAALRAMHLRLPSRPTLAQRCSGYAAVVARAFVQSALRAETVHKAMICRGIGGAFPQLEKTGWRRVDSALLIAAALPALALMVLG